MGILVLALLLVYAVSCNLLTLSSEPEISHKRMERFSRRCRLGISEENGPVVVHYLAVTRRWRTAGAVTGFCFGLGLGLSSGAILVDAT